MFLSRVKLFWPLCLLCVAFVATGCESLPVPPHDALTPGSIGLSTLDARTRARIDELTAMLEAGLGRPSEDAKAIAQISVVRSLQLRDEYGVLFPAWIHNLGVATRTASRGYCCHWARDILDALEPLEPTDFELTWSVAYFGMPREHSCLVAIPKGKVFADGIVIDGWRHGGKLFFIRVADDHDWKWVPRPVPKGMRLDCGG